MTKQKGRSLTEFKRLGSSLDAKQKVLVRDVIKALSDGADPDPIIMRARWLPKAKRVSLIDEVPGVTAGAAALEAIGVPLCFDLPFPRAA